MFGSHDMSPTEADAIVKLLRRNCVLESFQAHNRHKRHGPDKELEQAPVIDFYLELNREGLRRNFFGDASGLDLQSFLDLIAAQSLSQVETPLNKTELDDRERSELSRLFHLLRRNACVFVPL